MPTYSNLFVCVMGMGTVFVGLICIVYLTKLLGVLCRDRQPSLPPESTAVSAPASTIDRQELIAALSAAIAEDMGTDVFAIRILSVKKIS